MSLGSNIKNIRQNKDISVKDISRQLKIFEKAYLNIENGIKKPTNELLRKLASVFNLTTDDIINYNFERARIDKQRLDLKNLKSVDNKKVDSIEKKPVQIDNIKFIPIEKPSLRDIISTKSMLLNSKDLFKYKNNLDLVGSSVSPNSKATTQRILNLEEKNHRVSSPRLLSYVEPYKINNIEKTLFYTEVNTNYKIGDRVFIIGGPYDIDLSNTTDRYKKGRDGYKVLFVDKCKVVLDINYTGKLPFRRDKRDDFLNIYVAKDYSDFKLYSKQISTRGGIFQYKFSDKNNNILYAEKSFEQVDGNGGIPSSGFYVRINSSGQWVNISTQLLSSDYVFLLSTIFNSNNRIRINNSTINTTVNGIDYNLEKDGIYKWNSELGKWVIDKDFDEAIITKSNFRNGRFTGSFNGGLYGTKDNKIKWTGEGEWNMGTLFNTIWENGVIKSKYTLPYSYIAQFGKDGKPYEKSNGFNNNGSGFNFLLKSNLQDVVIENGNIYDTSFGADSTFSVVEDYIKENNTQFKFELNGGYYNNCDFVGGSLLNSSVNNCRSKKTKFNNVTSVNSLFTNSLMINSVYLSNNSIKILDYEELVFSDLNYVPVTHKIYKFYIDESGYNKLKARDKFYIKGLKIKDNNKYPLNFFNKRFKISTWTEYFEFYDKNEQDVDNKFHKRGMDMVAFLSTPGDNEFLHTSYQLSDNIVKNGIAQKDDRNLYSLDLLVSVRDTSFEEIKAVPEIPFSEVPRYGFNLNNDSETPQISSTSGTYSVINNLFLTNKVRNYVDIENAFIVNSDFDSGMIENTDWIDGDHIEYNNDNNISKKDDLKDYDITLDTSDETLLIKTTSNSIKLESEAENFQIGDIVYLNNIEYRVGNTSIILPDSYKVLNSDFSITGELLLQEIYNNTSNTGVLKTLNGLVGKFTYQDLDNRYAYIYRTKISKSKIKAGIFRRSYITDSLIENDEYDTNNIDFKDISNIKKLVISDGIFQRTRNILSKATYINSNFADGVDSFKDGIIFNSVWKGGVFNGGVFKSSSWENGVFNGGIFYDNRTFDDKPTQDNPSYNKNSIKSYYKIGDNRYSWINGEFNGGEFSKSNWESGIFNGGEFYYSRFYTGIINGGIFGKESIETRNTLIYSGAITDIIVENATLIAKNPNYVRESSFGIFWNNGEFNGGIIDTSPLDNLDQTKNVVVWTSGRFNGGELRGNTVWKDGEFNGGSFLSTHASERFYSNNRLDYAWQNGEFNGGEFGNAQFINNPSWWDGEFNGGEFKGKVWNNGLFTNGNFVGFGIVQRAIGRNNFRGGDEGNMASNFTDVFFNNNDNFFGLWRNGAVSDMKDKLVKDKKFFTKITRSNQNIKTKKAILEGVLWIDGIFDNKNAEMINSVWLNGSFDNGKFISSSFNPFVNRKRGDIDNKRTFNLTDNCIWNNGESIDSDFYISKWKNGTFNRGNGYGMHWIDGICLYMNAYNIFWENGTWKNGNWFGSYIDYNDGVNDSFRSEILKKGSELSDSNNYHIWNVFKKNESINEKISEAPSKNLITDVNIENGNFINYTLDYKTSR